jgi:hypothetical protein
LESRLEECISYSTSLHSIQTANGAFDSWGSALYPRDRKTKKHSADVFETEKRNLIISLPVTFFTYLPCALAIFCHWISTSDQLKELWSSIESQSTSKTQDFIKFLLKPLVELYSDYNSKVGPLYECCFDRSVDICAIQYLLELTPPGV